MEKYLYSKMSLSDIYKRLSNAEEPPHGGTEELNKGLGDILRKLLRKKKPEVTSKKEKIIWLDNDDSIENPQKQLLLEKLTQYHANAARPFEMLSSHMYGNHVYDLGNPEETKEINYQHWANALTAHIKHRNTIEDKMDDDEVQEALEKPIGQFAMMQWYPANIPAHIMGIKVASHVLGKDHPDISKVGHAATDAGSVYLSDLEEQGETFSPEKHLAPLHQAMLNVCAEGTPDMYTGEPLVYSEPPKPGSLGALKQKAPDISKSYKSNKKNFSEYDDVPLHEIYNQLSKSYKTPAWQRTEGQNPKGGLNAKGRASARAEGHNLKPPVKSGDNPRRASFLARMGNSPGPEHDENGNPTRLLLSLQAWGASSKADARKKAKAISARLKMRKSVTNRQSGNEIIQPAWKQADLTDQHNTELNPEQESAYQNWLSIQKVPTSTRDYDLKGFFADQVFGKTDTSEHKGHFDDRWKKPNHMTLSDQSNYAQILPDGSSTGGRWEQRLSPEDDPKGLGIWHFIRPIHGRIPDEPFREYYEREEPGNTWEMSSAPVIKPKSPDMPVVPQTGTTLKTPKAPSLKGPGGFAPRPASTVPGGFAPRPASTVLGGFTPPSPFPSADSTKKSFFFLNTQEKTITDICMERLEKGRGEDARTLFNGRSADQYNEKKYPTGKMIQSSSALAGLWGAGYRGVFGENRHLLVEALSKIPRKTKNPSEWYAEPYDRQEQQWRIPPPKDPYIEWIHIKPGTVVEPHHTRQVFQALYDAGFTGPNMTYNAIPDPDEQEAEEAYLSDAEEGYHPDPVTSVRHPRELRRDRLFRPWVKKWKEFVASQPPAPHIDTTQPAGEREDEDPWEGMKEFHEPEVNMERELEKYNDPEIDGHLRRSWFSVSIRRFE